MNEERSFQPGDRVRHRSGPPVMAVRQVREEDGVVECRWFDEKGRVFVTDSFKPVELEHVSDEDYYEADGVVIG